MARASRQTRARPPALPGPASAGSPDPGGQPTAPSDAAPSRAACVPDVPGAPGAALRRAATCTPATLLAVISASSLPDKHCGPLYTSGRTQRSTISLFVGTTSCFLLLSARDGPGHKIMEGLHSYSVPFFRQEKSLQDPWRRGGVSCC